MVNRPLAFGGKTLIFVRIRMMPIWKPTNKYKLAPLLKIFCDSAEYQCDDSGILDGSAAKLPHKPVVY
eukprot:TRINITY_DN4865_c0_g1_i1.p1 TRINITY_DN4865_c0_g1~~TRINITY_DN4865_c0_g1_i1.p1  ORF type:complete len:68 (+),score=6.85 TRINITY_DN4865_c0_g1_i1:241-444(+)